LTAEDAATKVRSESAEKGNEEKLGGLCDSAAKNNLLAVKSVISC
jgi:hypothetical protein